MRKILTILYLVFATTLSSIAQNQNLTITGQVVDSNSGKPVEFATVGILSKSNGEIIGGTVSDLEGKFRLESPTQNVTIQISFMGYHSKDIELDNGNGKVGLIKLEQNVSLLNEVIVRGEKSQTEFKLDKRVFNVGQDLSSTGASALEVLNNVPSVNVNIEGEISLRGSAGVQILINGKPSVLSEQGNALGTITADMIEKVEVITNPSAKYDAEGTAGIINIVIKKEDRKGTNGSISLNTGVPHNHSLGFSLNHRTEKFNIFTQIGAGYRELPNDIRNINTDLVENETVLTNGEEFRNENFYNFILGTDYHINDFNVLTVSGNFSYEIEDQPSETNFEFLDSSGEVVSTWKRTEVTEATNPKWQYEVQYKRDFADNKEHQLLMSAIGNFFGKDLTSEFLDEYDDVDILDTEQFTRTKFQEARNTLKLDYTRPISETWTIETGAQYVLNNVSNDFEVSDLVDGERVINENFTNTFEWDQNVLAGYGTAAYENEKWGIKGGLRVENTDLKTLLVTTDEAGGQNFTNLFPSIHSSYKVSKNYSIQAGYSRRIFRPRLWDLNPFFNIRNNFNIRTGNPNLLPEFTDSYEVTAIYDLKDLSLNTGVFHRYTTDQIERISTVEDNVNTTTPYNIGTNRSTGLELNAKYTPVKWLTVNGDFNYNYFVRQGTFETTTFDFSADQWTSKVNSKVKLPGDVDFEVTGQYRSKVRTVQGNTKRQIFADMGARKKILNGKGVINLSVRDIFASRIRINEVDQPEFYAYSWRQRGRFIQLGFSYGFGKGEAMEYSGRRR